MHYYNKMYASYDEYSSRWYLQKYCHSELPINILKYKFNIWPSVSIDIYEYLGTSLIVSNVNIRGSA